MRKQKDPAAPSSTRKQKEARQKTSVQARHSGEGAHSALERLRELEKAKAAASGETRKRRFFG